MSRKRPARVLSERPEKWHNCGMEQMIQALREIGISPETIEAIERAEDQGQAREHALLLIALFDDRHEYVD